ncbi:related to ERV1 - mitochondrial biogenesis and regulation of cell cycle [Pseudozyma flocculosa]|uniref:Sulfhydryl oxidase n=1 Tax=Pseudozyma flocculosa TaxID=84751 RepID=A0A5C3EZ66_9BASI|nr:related to ERV1 - mitochondrial biogenesis and regulation of cell cycle [Pseudozyma flocculosa]
MPTFSSKPLRRPPSALSRLAPKVRQRPVLFFGLPFIITIVGASFGLSTLTQTRYDYNAQKVQTITKEEELRLKRDRKKVDLREEYFKLQAKSDELDEWEPKRISRPEGTPEWGVPPTSPSESSTSKGKISLEGLSQADVKAERDAGISSESIKPSAKHPAVVLGPDGKPCRACNSKLAFSAAFKKAKPAIASPVPSSGGEKEGSAKAAGAAAAVATAGSALGSQASTNDAADSDQLECPPDGIELGRSTWTFLHSAAAYFPASPTTSTRVTAARGVGEEYRREERDGGWEEKGLRMKEAVRSGPALRKWLCGIHNEVNHRLGKAAFECSEERLNERWKDGPADGRCD